MSLSIGYADKIGKKFNNLYLIKNEQSNKIQQYNQIDELPFGQMYLTLVPPGKEAPSKSLYKPYEDYDNAEKLFRKNLQLGKPIFGNADDLSFILSNDKIRRNLIEFLPKYAQEQLDAIDKNNPDNAETIEGLTEVRDFFNDFREVWSIDKKNNKKISQLHTYVPKANLNPSRMVAFAGDITREEEKISQLIVHGFSAACALISSAFGEGAAVGADTAALRCLQFAMFSIMTGYLEVHPAVALMYYAQEMHSAAMLGVQGAHLVTSWLGIGAHAASVASGTSFTTCGGSDAAINGGVRAVNGALSFLITERMGRRFIRKVKNNQMNFKFQMAESASYFISRGILAGVNPFDQLSHIDFQDAKSPELIKNALLRIPPSSQDAFSSFIDIAKDIGCHAGKIFGINMATNLIFMDKSTRDLETMKLQAKKMFKQAFINAAVFEICDLAVEDRITDEATKTIEDIQKNLEKYPEVFRVFVKADHEFFEKINLDTLKTDAFTNQFKNRDFVYALSRWSNDCIREFSDAWRNRERKIQAEQMMETRKAIEAEKRRKAEIAESISEEDKAAIEADLNAYSNIIKQQAPFLQQTSGFGYGKIGGYKDIKETLAHKFIMPVSTEGTEVDLDVPAAILFYGPTGVGKTEFTKALAQQAKCITPKFNPRYSEEELLEDLDNARKKAKEKDRRTVLRINEFDGFGSDPKLAKVFSDFMENCSKDNITLMLTTNEPKKIDKKILEKTINIPVPPPDKENMIDVFKFYLEDKVDDNFDYNKLANKLLSQSGNRAYSNAQIEDICKRAVSACLQNNTNINSDFMLEFVETVTPEIEEQDLEKFKHEMEEII